MRSLTEREREVLELIGRGYSLVEIAKHLHRSVETVKSHRRSLARKLGTRNRVLLAQVAMRLNADPQNEGDSSPATDDSSRQLLLEGLEASAMPSIRCDANLSVRAANQTACEWLHLTATQIIGRPLQGLPSLGHSTDLVELCARVVASERSESRLIELVRGSRGSRFLVSASPVIQERIGALSDVWLTWQDTAAIAVGSGTGTIATDSVGAGLAFESMRRDNEARRKAETRLREVVAGIGWSSGIGLFRQLVRHLCQALDLPHAMVCGKLSTDPSDLRLSAIAGWSRGAPVELFDFDPSDGPCQLALSGHTCHIAEAARTLYPHAPIVQRLGAESFLGLPLVAHDGSTLGILCVLDDKPMPEAFEALPILRAFAARSAAELDRRNAESALRSTIERHNHLLSVIPTVLYLSDTDGRCTYANKSVAEVTGRELNGNLGSDWLNHVHPDDRQRVMEICDRAVAERRDIRGLVFRYIRPDGSIVSVVDGASCYYDQSGRFQGWIGTTTPISTDDLRMLNYLAQQTAHEN